MWFLRGWKLRGFNDFQVCIRFSVHNASLGYEYGIWAAAYVVHVLNNAYEFVLRKMSELRSIAGFEIGFFSVGWGGKRGKVLLSKLGHDNYYRKKKRSAKYI